MQIYLPIAEVSINVFSLLALGGVVGVLSGLFGVGGGFLMTPFLIFLGVPPEVSVATQANHIIGSSVSGTLAHVRRKGVDFHLGAYLVLGGLFGATIGVAIFTWMKKIGQINLFISLSYVLLLGVVGSLMLKQSLKAVLSMSKQKPLTKLHHHHWAHNLPLKVKFRLSRLYVSSFLPFMVGFVVGILMGIMGIGGGFILVPALIYIIGMPAHLVVGTTLFQGIFITCYITLLQAVQNQNVDMFLAFFLLIGGVIGAQYGSRWGTKIKGEHFRVVLAVLVLLVCFKMLYSLFIPPLHPYSIEWMVP